MLKIAVVEDEEFYRDQLLGYLKRYGEERRIPLDVSSFGDGEDIAEDYRADFSDAIKAFLSICVKWTA